MLFADDAEYASIATDWRPVSGGVVMCAGDCVSWCSRTKKYVTLWTTEAEYVSMSETRKEVIFIRYIWSYLFPGFGVRCIKVFEDISIGTVMLARNPVTTSNSKHIEGRHFLRELVSNGEFEIIHAASAQQHADFLTKPRF